MVHVNTVSRFWLNVKGGFYILGNFFKIPVFHGLGSDRREPMARYDGEDNKQGAAWEQEKGRYSEKYGDCDIFSLGFHCVLVDVLMIYALQSQK